MKAHLPGCLWSKWECFLMSGWWDIPHLSCFNVKLWSNSTNETNYKGTNQQTNGWLCWGLTSQSTIFQSCQDGAIASWVFNQYFRGVKCLAQGHNTAAVGLEPRTSRSGVRHSTTEPPCSPYRRLERRKLYNPRHKCQAYNYQIHHSI